MPSVNLIVVVFSLAFIAPAISASINSSYIDNYELPKCGNRFCAQNAVCNDGTCECPSNNPSGNSLLKCYDENTAVCTYIADPVVSSFNFDFMHVPFDCQYRLTVIDIPILKPFRCTGATGFKSYKQDITKNRLEIIVDAQNGRTRAGTYYVERVDITLNLRVASINLVTVQITLDSSGAKYSCPLLKILEAIPFSLINKGTCNSRLFANTNLDFFLCHDVLAGLFRLTIQRTEIAFRPFDISTENQIARAGVSISTDVDQNPVFPEPASLYPNSFCDSIYNDRTDVYSERCNDYGIHFKYCSTYALLEYGLDQQPPQCAASRNAFKNIPQTDRVAALELCGSIITEFSTCCDHDGLNHHTVFQECLADFARSKTISESTLNKLRGGRGDCGTSINKHFGRKNISPRPIKRL